MDKKLKNRIIELTKEQINNARIELANNRFPGHISYATVASWLIKEHLITESDGWCNQMEYKKIMNDVLKKEKVKINKDNTFIQL